MAEIYNKLLDQVEQVADELQALVGSAIFSAGDTAGESNSASGGAGDSSPEFNLEDLDMDDLDLDSMSEEQIQSLQQMLAEELRENNPLKGIAEGVTQEILAGQAQPENLREHFDAFRSAINWSEKFVLGLIAFQIVMFFLSLYVAQRDRALAPKLVVMTFIFIVVRSAEWLNTKGEEHWESFATQDYFDDRGLFLGIMLVGPLMLDIFMMLIFFMREASLLLVEVKRTEIKRKKGKEKKKSKGSRSKTEKQD